MTVNNKKEIKLVDSNQSVLPISTKGKQTNQTNRVPWMEGGGWQQLR